MNNIPISIPPEAAGVVTALSQMGYNAQTAISDLLDNSIQAGANQISILFTLGEGWLEIKDNGAGMSDSQICEAFIYGKRREGSGLGKFGMGLKTAATSIGKTVRIFSSANGEEVKLSNTYTLDLDQIEKTNKWEIYQSGTETTFTRSFIQWLNRLAKDGAERTTGTVVRIEKLRNLLDREYADKQSKPYQKACKTFDAELIQFIGLVFHRYLETGLNIKVNGKKVDPSNLFSETETLWKREYTQAGRNTDAVVNVSILKTKEATGVYYYRENRVIDFGQLRHGLRKEDNLVVIYSFDAEADCFLEANTQKSRIERVNLDADWLNEIDAAVKDAKQSLKDKDAATRNISSNVPEEPNDKPSDDTNVATQETPIVIGEKGNLEELEISSQPTSAAPLEHKDLKQAAVSQKEGYPEAPEVAQASQPASNGLVEPKEYNPSSTQKDPITVQEVEKKHFDTMEKAELVDLLRSIRQDHPQILPNYV